VRRAGAGKELALCSLRELEQDGREWRVESPFFFLFRLLHLFCFSLERAVSFAPPFLPASALSRRHPKLSLRSLEAERDREAETASVIETPLLPPDFSTSERSFSHFGHRSFVPFCRQAPSPLDVL